MVHLLSREREKIIPLQQNQVLLPTATLMFTSIDARRSLRRIEISRKITFEFRTSGEQRVDTTMEYRVECSKFHPNNNNNNNNNNKQHRDTATPARYSGRKTASGERVAKYHFID